MHTNPPASLHQAQAAPNGDAVGLTFQNAVKPPIDIFDFWFWAWVTLGILVVATAVFFLVRAMARKKATIPPLPVVPPHEKARRKLEQALSLISEPKPFSIAVSDILRVYLEERFQFHAPDRTTEEFLQELQVTNLLTTEQKLSLTNFLSSCDLVKFAKYEPTEVELRELHAAACRLVNETEPTPLTEISQPPPPPANTPESATRNPQSAIQ